MSSCNAVKFFSDLLNYVDISVKDLHGKQKQQKRTSTYFDFCQADQGIMLCTDVAQRGLDFPEVDWIVQFDPPDDPEEYIHRVGRTARGARCTGKALLFLQENELGFLRFLQQRLMIPLTEFSVSKMANVKDQFEKLVERNFYLNCAAKEAYKSFLQSYSSHKMKDVYNVLQLDLQKVAMSFGLKFPPKVNLNVKTSGRNARNHQFKQLIGKRKQFYSKGGEESSAKKW